MRYWILVRKLLLSRKDLVPESRLEGASTIYLKGIFGTAVKCPLVYVPIGLATGGQVNVVHQQVLSALGRRSFGRRRVASTTCFGYVGRSPESGNDRGKKGRNGERERGGAKKTRGREK
ncbi:hypothetical protein TNCV_367841 [Trichonephila clavipes]|nr:hypothetical protein TNCV_367841 [Trichonephila clavipes]